MIALPNALNLFEAYASLRLWRALLRILIGSAALCFLYYLLLLPLYNVFLHPLRRIPGPKTWAATRLFYSWRIGKGTIHKDLLDLHQIYGPVIRVAPDTVNVLHPEGQRDLKGHRKGGLDENGKDPINYALTYHSLIGAPREEHSMQRRILSNAFSAQTMMEQQPIILGYIDKLFQGLHKASQNGTQLVEMTSWLNWLTFDIIGDLAFGEPFGCLETSSYHSWVSLTFTSLKYVRLRTELLRLGPLLSFMQNYLIGTLGDNHKENSKLSALRVRKRLDLGTNRPDFIEKMVEGGRNKAHPLSFQKLVANAELLIIAGSETTATLLSSALYFMTTHPLVLPRLTNEIRSAYQNESDIDLLNTQHLKYFNAVINETLRIHPPVPNSGPRVIAPGGSTIAGVYIPQNTVVDTDMWAIFHDPKSFTLPDAFIPERWLGDECFKNDRLDAVEPFSVGPRNCIGKNLAYAEIRIILTRLVWNFDIEICEEDKNWVVDQKAFTAWEKPDLRMRLKPRKET